MVNIQISDKFWKFLNSSKNVGESFEDVIMRLLDMSEKIRKEHEKMEGPNA